MPDTSAISGHQLWFQEARRIIDLTQHRALPIPALSAARASFSFVTVTHADDTLYMVTMAEEVLSGAFRFDIAWFTRYAEAGSARHRIRTAVLPSGMQVDLVALARHFADEDAELSLKAVA